MANPKYSDEVKTYVVQALACFDSPAVVAKAVKAEFDVVISPQAVEAYDPTKRAGRKLSQRFRLLFEETRKTFLEDTATIAISHRAVRLRALQRMAEKAETQGNMVLAASLMKQAAEEVGNAYTNRRELTGKDGKDLPVPVSPVTIFQLPDNGRS
ncbi:MULTISPECIES: DUF2280 domain-containing protein [Sinorhizobium]|uniref:DUF2280 domain-containing protein n=1 Tax=Sinorhizobium TaxID=28105 RepID=UPI000FD866B4|nr:MULTISPECIES: DUF2280 domain-containing protein [Sinorhizobium]MDE3825871.1 DUF2280 domain-containing protein [Sinorhizobium meliloti]RVH87594.1 DUF2280 domain-containing protein [Sinorhizobium meliloti]RVI03665.1 DUF2280 domain-containing protein [Sinorhizobium meliloti]RVK94016.1 DUF2280 domain-containing protein [Sinorhizobium meliloti]RVM22448.1 DUF2280 domain-containing protein [Sinorhizobium meliloti]